MNLSLSSAFVPFDPVKRWTLDNLLFSLLSVAQHKQFAEILMKELGV